MWPAIDDHSRLFDASTLLDSTMDPFSLRLAVYSKSSSFRAPEPQKCLHLPELGCVCSRWKLLGLFEVSTRNASIYRSIYCTRPSGRGPVPGHFIFVHSGTTENIAQKKKGRKIGSTGKLDLLWSLLRANLKTWNSDQISETLSLVVYVVLK